MSMLDRLPDGGMVELNAYFPEILYLNGAYDRAFRALLVQVDPGLERREYPEVSYTALGHIAGFLMGVRPLAAEGVVETKSRLINEVKWAEITHVPVLFNEISIRHDGRRESRLRNESGRAVRWRAVFSGRHARLMVEGRGEDAGFRTTPGEGAESWVEVEVGPGKEVVVGVEETG
ncbi:MAG: hypothetical protein ACWGSQ_16420 [Longimicrobiales bacterium]